jgi:soluble lytic murein transglycosylase-like protein
MSPCKPLCHCVLRDSSGPREGGDGFVTFLLLSSRPTPDQAFFKGPQLEHVTFRIFPRTLPRAVRSVGTGIAATAAIAVTATHVRPVFLGREPVVQRLVAMSWRDSAAVRAPWLVGDADVAMSDPRFEADRLAFALDLLRTGRVSAERADSLATIAVREAYTRKVPPALVFGVLLTENDAFRSSARSNVGAVGLMQIHAPAWKRSLGRYFGTDLRDDETNLRYGVYILRHVIARVPDSASMADGWRTALLRYNGCVRGTNTPNCRSYPDLVRREIEEGALALCGDASFEQCIVQPVWLSVRDGDARSDPTLRLTQVASR